MINAVDNVLPWTRKDLESDRSWTHSFEWRTIDQLMSAATDDFGPSASGSNAN